MKIVHSGDPGVLNLRSNVVGCVVVAGLILMAGGMLTVAFALGAIPIEASLEPELKNIVLAGGTLITLLGLVFFGGRSGKIIDGRSRSLMTWRGLVVPMSRKILPLNGYSWIVLTKEIHRSKNSSTTLYPVRLEGDSEQALTIDTASDVLEARRLSEAIAKVLRLPMTDSTSGQTVIRDPDLLDEGREISDVRIGDVHALRELRDARVARRAIYLFDKSALGKFPNDRVFAATTADHKNLHAPTPSNLSLVI